jgi:hypothetical protein
MKYTNDQLGCSFDLPDRPTVRQQLVYWDAIRADSTEEPTLIRLWAGVAKLADNWDCAALPDPSVSLDDLDNPSQTQVVTWAGLKAFGHFNALEDLPKA